MQPWFWQETPVSKIWRTQNPHNALPLLPKMMCIDILLDVPGVYTPTSYIYDASRMRSYIDNAGVHIVHDIVNPCHMGWQGPIFWYDGYSWSTKQHAFCYEILRAAGKTKMEARARLMQEYFDDPTAATVYTHAAVDPTEGPWHSVCLQKVQDILLAAALGQEHFMRALLEPGVVLFDMVMPPHYGEQEWFTEGSNLLGQLLSDTKYVLRSLATYVSYYRGIATQPGAMVAPYFWGYGIRPEQVPEAIKSHIYHLYDLASADYNANLPQ